MTGGKPGLADEVEHVREELDELAELRRLATDTCDPEPTSHTGTYSSPLVRTSVNRSLL